MGHYAFEISEAAKLRQRLILDNLTAEGVASPLQGRPIGTRITAPGTREEKAYLKQAALDYFLRSHEKEGEQLIAHGGIDCDTLCQILLDGQLKHIHRWESYGMLSAMGETIEMGGFWDHGWGLFVTRQKAITECLDQSQQEDYFIVPLQRMEGILFPSAIVGAVRRVFPDYTHVLKGYRQYAEEIEKMGG